MRTRRLRNPRFLVVAALALVVAGPAAAQGNDPLSKPYADAIQKLNEAHAQKPGKVREPELAAKLPKPARAALEKLLAAKDSPALAESLRRAGEAALDLDLIDDFRRIRERLAKLSADEAAKLGAALSRPRFVLRGLNGLDEKYLEGFAEVLEAVLGAYDEIFGFAEWSKVPGKKLRVRVHLEEKITRPPHFAPEHAFHSEIDFPVIDPKVFKSPTAEGQFLFYGLCHELGHVIAMWGDLRKEEDHHAWAHYTGVAVVEHLAEKAKDKPFMKPLADVRWRSLSAEKKRLESHEPALASRDGVLALLIALHDAAGPKAFGDAINFLDSKDKRRRINKVRYYTFKELREGLMATLKDANAKKAAGELLEGA
jgi:hypothetical protein